MPCQRSKFQRWVRQVAPMALRPAKHILPAKRCSHNPYKESEEEGLNIGTTLFDAHEFRTQVAAGYANVDRHNVFIDVRRKR
jgi:hypothetical protein